MFRAALLREHTCKFAVLKEETTTAGFVIIIVYFDLQFVESEKRLVQNKSFIEPRWARHSSELGQFVGVIGQSWQFLTLSEELCSFQRALVAQ